MPGITPLLDTLLHDVLGKRAGPSSPRQVPEAVHPVSQQDTLTDIRSDSRLQGGQGPAAVSAGQQYLKTGNALSPTAFPAESQLGHLSADADSVRLHFSSAGRVIAQLLQRLPDAPPALGIGSPLVDSAATPQEVARQLQGSIRDSGLFYESHLLRWSRGEYPLKAIRLEPQMQLARQAGTGAEPGGEVRRADTSAQMNLIDNEVMQGLVRHQLELLATPVLRWEGDIWSGVFMALVIHAPNWPASQGEDKEGDQEEADGRSVWHAHIELQVKEMGDIGVDIHLNQEALGLTLWADESLLPRLESGRQRLVERLEMRGYGADSLRLDIRGREDYERV